MVRFGTRTFTDTDLLVMGIVNRTPDSFFDRGATYDLGPALAKATEAVELGADIVDVGGVKAGRGTEVSVAEELRRVGPVVTALRERFPDLVISVDTYRAEVAREVVSLGCDLINDPWGGFDPQLAAVAAETGAALVCSHAGGARPRSEPHRVSYDDVVGDVVSTCLRLAESALAAGVRRDGIVLDPCHDFNKNTYHSLEVTRRLDELTAAGWPVLVALSNKDFIGESLDLPLTERLEGTLAASVYCAMKGAQIFRAHDVAATRRALDMISVIRGDKPPAAVRRALG